MYTKLSDTELAELARWVLRHENRNISRHSGDRLNVLIEQLSARTEKPDPFDDLL